VTIHYRRALVADNQCDMWKCFLLHSRRGPLLTGPRRAAWEEASSSRCPQQTRRPPTALPRPSHPRPWWQAARWEVGGRGWWGSGRRHTGRARHTASPRWRDEKLVSAGGGAAVGDTRSGPGTRRLQLGAMGRWWARVVGQRSEARGAATTRGVSASARRDVGGRGWWGSGPRHAERPRHSASPRRREGTLVCAGCGAAVRGTRSGHDTRRLRVGAMGSWSARRVGQR